MTDREIEEIRAIINRWLRGGEMEMRAGEMTAQEKRTAKAILLSVRSEIETTFTPVPGLAHAFRNADDKDWAFLFDNLLDHSGHGQFWRAVMTEARAALSAMTEE